MPVLVKTKTLLLLSFISFPAFSGAQAGQTYASETYSLGLIDSREPDIMKARKDSLHAFRNKIDDLTSIAYTIRHDAKGKSDSVTSFLIREAKEIEQQLHSTQIAFYEMSSKINCYEFTRNSKAILYLISTCDKNDIPNHIHDLIFEAGKAMRYAAEMKEEAYTHTLIISRIGPLGNAHEKEETALTKQCEVLAYLKKIKKNRNAKP
jgi:hypothetical protein